MSTQTTPTIRPAVAADVPAIHALIVELAVYEREPDAVEATVDDLSTALFGPAPSVFCQIAQADDGTVVGFALWFVTFSTWRGRHGVWLEDLYVSPTHRGSGTGAALLSSLAAICVTRGYARLEWNVLDWNAPAIGFYQAIGALPLDEWRQFRLTGGALAALAARADRPSRT